MAIQPPQRFELDDLAHVEREARTIYAPGATPGDVLVVQSDHSLVAAPGGGSQPDLALVTGGLLVCDGLAGCRLPTTSSSATVDQYGVSDTGVDVFRFWRLASGLAIAGFAFESHFQVTGLYRLGLYLADARGQPERLIFDSGEQDCSVAGRVDVAAPQALAAGTYLAALCFDADAVANSISLVSVGIEVFEASLELGFAAPGSIYSSTPGSPFTVTRPRTFGAFPDPGDPWDTIAQDTLAGIIQGGSDVRFPLFAVGA